MRAKKIVWGAILAIILSITANCMAAVESANEKLTKIELDTYGAEQTGALLDRISRLEKNYSGRNMNGNMNARIEAIYDILYDNSAGPGVLAKINALEWNLNHEVSSLGLDLRISALENEIFGKTSDGTFNERILELSKASYGAEILPIAQIQVPADILIKIETTMPVSSKNLQEGDNISVKVVDDVFIDGRLVFARGLSGEGMVTKVIRAKNIFSNGKIETDFYTLKTIDGQNAKIFSGVESLEAMDANSMANGLSLLGKTFSGKNKELAEVFIRGKNIDLPAGVELFVQIRDPIVVYGVKTDGGSIYPAENVNSEEKTESVTVIETLTADEHNARPDYELERALPTREEQNSPAKVDSEPKTDDEIIEIIDED